MRRRLVILACSPAVLLLVGTLGYLLIEGWPLFDSLYMTVITLTTIGFGEVRPLGLGGRAFTMALALGGIFTLFFATAEVLRFWAGGELKAFLVRRRFERKMSALRNHVVVCGYGRMGRLVCQEFAGAGVPYVVIERQEELLEAFDVPHGVPLHGDATSDEVLKQAGIGHARAVVSVVASDADNLFITMSARLLNEGVPIVARAEEESTAKKLLRAGATRIVSPYVIGGTRVAHAILRPAVLDFIEVATGREQIELQIEEVSALPGSRLSGETLGSCRVREDFNVIVVAIKRQKGPMTFNPGADERIEAGDTLVMLGHRSQLDRIEALASS
jgi:voltage-gated potassium channel